MDAAHLYLSEPIPGLTAVPHQLKGLNKAQTAALWALCTEFRKCYENTLYVYTIAYLTPKTKTLAPNQHLSCAVLLIIRHKIRTAPLLCHEQESNPSKKHQNTGQLSLVC